MRFRCAGEASCTERRNALKRNLWPYQLPTRAGGRWSCCLPPPVSSITLTGPPYQQRCRKVSAELPLGPVAKGVLLSAFFWSYTLLQVPAGIACDWWSVRWVFAAGFAVWSIACGHSGIAAGLGVLILLRLVLGVGESVLQWRQADSPDGSAQSLCEPRIRYQRPARPRVSTLSAPHSSWRDRRTRRMQDR
jgi:MFS family permease